MQRELVCRLAENSRVKVVGLGGIGCWLLPPLVLFLKNMRQPVRLTLIDGDTFDPVGNAGRMLFQSAGNKAEVKAAEIIALAGTCDVSILAVPEYVSPHNIEQLIRDGDIVFLCVDNHPTRKLVSDHCGRLQNSLIISGGNEGVDPPRERGTYGNVQVAWRRLGKDLTAPLTKYHPEIAQPAGKLPTEMDCIELAQSKPQIHVTNHAVASAMLSAFFAYACGQLSYQEVKLDVLDARMLPQFPVDPRNLATG